MCKNCRKDFIETENFSWKCRTHRCEYAAEDDLWWCCLKKGFNSVGCKLQKHEALDNSSDEEDDRQKSKSNEMKNKRCQCCKEFGHLI